MELVLDKGLIGSLVWMKTTERLIIVHENHVPAALPSRERFDELRANGWRATEIARMYGTCHRSIFEGLR